MDRARNKLYKYIAMWLIIIYANQLWVGGSFILRMTITIFFAYLCSVCMVLSEHACVNICLCSLFILRIRMNIIQVPLNTTPKSWHKLIKWIITSLLCYLLPNTIIVWYNFSSKSALNLNYCPSERYHCIYSLHIAGITCSDSKFDTM